MHKDAERVQTIHTLPIPDSIIADNIAHTRIIVDSNCKLLAIKAKHYLAKHIHEVTASGQQKIFAYKQTSGHEESERIEVGIQNKQHTLSREFHTKEVSCDLAFTENPQAKL